MRRFRTAVRSGVGRVARSTRQCCLCCIGLQDRDTRPRTVPPPTPTPSSTPPTPLQTPLSVPPTPPQTPPASLCLSSLTTLQPSLSSEGRTGTGSCHNVCSTNDSDYISQEESSVASASQREGSVDSDSPHKLTRSCSCPLLVKKNIKKQLQRSKSLFFTTSFNKTPQPPISSTPSLVSSQSPSCNKCNTTSCTVDSAYASEEGSVKSDSTPSLTRSCSCPQLSVENLKGKLQRSNSLPFTTSSQPTPQLPTLGTPLVSSQSPHGQRCEGRPFQVVLEQRVSGVGLLLGRGVSGGVVIKYLVSFGTAAKEGTLRTGDHLLEVNGRSVVGRSVEEVRTLLRWIPRRERVTIMAMAPPKDLTPPRSPFFTGGISVTLKTSYFCSPGIGVEGGGNSHIQIASITPGSPADLCGLLRVGDELVEVNEHAMVGASLSEAMAVLQRHCLPMHVTVQCRTVPKPIACH